MSSLQERSGRLLLHLREAEHGLSEAQVALRAGESVAADLAALLDEGKIKEENGAYSTNPDPMVRAALDASLGHELVALTEQKRLYFAYGSNMDPDRMRQRVPAARFLCRAVLPGYTLTFPRGSRNGGWVAGFEPAPDGGVWGVLYLVDTDGLLTLDEREGTGYRRQGLPVEVRLARTGGRIEAQAQTYVAEPDGSGGGPPRSAYLQHLLWGAAAFDLPRHYEELLRGVAVWTEDAAPAPEVLTEPTTGRGSKYEPLASYLNAQDRGELTLSFAEMEQILGFPLPPSAQKHMALWYPSPTHVLATLLEQNGWRATPHLRELTVTFRRQWNREVLLQAAAQRLSSDDTRLFGRLYDWAAGTGEIVPGGGRAPGFSWRPPHSKSAFSAYTDGVIFVRFGWLGRTLPVERVEALRQRLAGLPGARDMDEPIAPDEDQHGTLPLACLQEPAHWETFTDGLRSL